MNTNTPDAQSLAGAGMAALRRGDPHSARALFARALSIAPGDAAAWYGSSVAHRALNSPAEESAALDQALRLDVNFLPALIAKGDFCARQGDRRAASSYYSAASKLAISVPGLNAEWREEIRRVEAASRGIAESFEKHLLASLSDQESVSAPARFRRGVELLLGKRQIFLQQPTNFYYPELPQIEFYERQDFTWAGAVEARTRTIKAEISALIGETTGWAPYIEMEKRRPNYANPLLNDPNWSAFYLIKNGTVVVENAARCPHTMDSLRDLPLCRVPGRTPSVLFSLLRPGTRIRPHHGYTNARLICHLPLIVPAECGLRVGNDTREWHEGELLVFDDSIEHEAWNLSNEPRVVMIFDVWRPELSEQEQTLVAAMLEAVDLFDSGKS